MDESPIRLDILRSPCAAGGAPSRHRWGRAVVRRLADALQRADAGDIVAVGGLVVGLLEQERDGAAASRRVAALLDAILMAPGAVLAQDVRVLLEDAAEGLLQMPPGTRPDDVAQQLGILLREV